MRRGLGGRGLGEPGISIWIGARTKVPTENKPAQGSSKRVRRVETGGRQERRRRAGMDITWLTERIGVGGGIWTAENMQTVAKQGITHIIDMQIEFDDTALAKPHGIAVLWNPTDDDFELKPPELFRRGVQFAERALESPNTRVFVHCAAGVHRAPMMALALLGSMGWELNDAMELIEGRRPVADFAEVYVESVEKFLNGTH
jgi:protein-tyrosine phosphatase